jgi:colicin import membrane protein
MNAETKTELQAITQSAVDAMAVVTLSPEKYAAEVYQPFKAKLASAIDSVRAIDYDIKTTAGMQVAIKARALFRDLRVDADKERKARKEPITKIGKLLESGFDGVEELITPLELLFDADIKAEEGRKETERLAKVAAERARIEGLQAKIQAIRDLALAATGKPSATIKALLETLAGTEVEAETFADFTEDARKAVCETALHLEELFATADAAEKAEVARLAAVAAEQERIAGERAELARQQAELAAAKAAQDAAAAAERLAIQKEQARLAEVAEEAERRAKAEQVERAIEAAYTKRQLEAQAKQIAEERAKLEAEKEEARVAMLPVEPLLEVRETIVTLPEDGCLVVGEDNSLAYAPDAETLVMIVANELGTDRATALAWLLEADFESLAVA